MKYRKKSRWHQIWVWAIKTYKKFPPLEREFFCLKLHLVDCFDEVEESFGAFALVWDGFGCLVG